MNADIATAAERCRAAFDAAPDATDAWCCHHAIEYEQLTEPAGHRIDYILAHKPEREQVVRLDNFRPVLSLAPASWAKARTDWDKASAAWYRASADWIKARAERDKASVDWDKTKARADMDKASADMDKASVDWDKAGADCDKAGGAWDKTEAHLADVPHHTWNGTDIFEKRQP